MYASDAPVLTRGFVASQVSSYKRRDSPKEDRRAEPYKLHCTFCDAAVGSTVRMGKKLVDCFAWDKSTLSLPGDQVLPSKRWYQHLDVIKKYAQADNSEGNHRDHRRPTHRDSDLLPTNYCQVLVVLEDVYMYTVLFCYVECTCMCRWIHWEIKPGAN